MDTNLHGMLPCGFVGPTHEGVCLPYCRTCKVECGHIRIYLFSMLHDWGIEK